MSYIASEGFRVAEINIFQSGAKKVLTETKENSI